MVLFIVLLSGFFIGIPTIISPTTQKYLRNPSIFKILIGISLLIIITTMISFHEFVLEQKEELAFIAMSPLTFLILHKITDQFWKKKYGRHIYFYKKHSNDEESKESSWIEFFLQMLISIIPFFWIGIGNYIVKHFMSN